MLKALTAVLVTSLGLSVLASVASAQESSSEVCSTTVEADVVISGAAGQPELVASVARSVPSDPVHCVPSYCLASEDEQRNVQVAVGVGISDAFANLVAKGDDDEAARILDGACGGTCNEIVLTAFAASQGTSVGDLCETSVGGGSAGGASALVIRASGGGGGQLPSGN